MSGWTPDELRSVTDADELQVSSFRPDGTARPFVIIWFVRQGDELYVRSAQGPQNGWYRRAVDSGAGRVRVAGIEKDVTFEHASAGPDHAGLDAAYHAKYDRYGPGPVGAVVGPAAVDVTLHLLPR